AVDEDRAPKRAAHNRCPVSCRARIVPGRRSIKSKNSADRGLGACSKIANLRVCEHVSGFGSRPDVHRSQPKGPRAESPEPLWNQARGAERLRLKGPSLLGPPSAGRATVRPAIRRAERL